MLQFEEIRRLNLHSQERLDLKDIAQGNGTQIVMIKSGTNSHIATDSFTIKVAH